jgi:3-phenylpropionate/trans-cinnamate dioxygenase ferredoxin component
MDDATYHPVLALADLPDDATRVVALNGFEVLLCRFKGQVYALENRCSHAESPLDCGRIRLGWIACPAHGARFDLETGEALGPPATQPVRSFAVRIAGDMIEIAL